MNKEIIPKTKWFLNFRKMFYVQRCNNITILKKNTPGYIRNCTIIIFAFLFSFALKAKEGELIKEIPLKSIYEDSLDAKREYCVTAHDGRKIDVKTIDSTFFSGMPTRLPDSNLVFFDRQLKFAIKLNVHGGADKIRVYPKNIPDNCLVDIVEKKYCNKDMPGIRDEFIFYITLTALEEKFPNNMHKEISFNIYLDNDDVHKIELDPISILYKLNVLNKGSFMLTPYNYGVIYYIPPSDMGAYSDTLKIDFSNVGRSIIYYQDVQTEEYNSGGAKLYMKGKDTSTGTDSLKPKDGEDRLFYFFDKAIHYNSPGKLNSVKSSFHVQFSYKPGDDPDDEEFQSFPYIVSYGLFIPVWFNYIHTAGFSLDKAAEQTFKWKIPLKLYEKTKKFPSNLKIVFEDKTIPFSPAYKSPVIINSKSLEECINYFEQGGKELKELEVSYNYKGTDPLLLYNNGLDYYYYDVYMEYTDPFLHKKLKQYVGRINLNVVNKVDSRNMSGIVRKIFQESKGVSNLQPLVFEWKTIGDKEYTHKLPNLLNRDATQEIQNKEMPRYLEGRINGLLKGGEEDNSFINFKLIFDYNTNTFRAICENPSININGAVYKFDILVNGKPLPLDYTPVIFNRNEFPKDELKFVFKNG